MCVVGRPSALALSMERNTCRENQRTESLNAKPTHDRPSQMRSSNHPPSCGYSSETLKM
jgi:hypothetical protein